MKERVGKKGSKWRYLSWRRDRLTTFTDGELGVFVICQGCVVDASVYNVQWLTPGSYVYGIWDVHVGDNCLGVGIDGVNLLGL
jgi:hypothetical protein